VNDKVQEKLSYTYIGHFSRYIQPGARRIASTKYTDNLSIVSLKNPDGTIVVVFLNCSQENVPVKLRLNGQVTELVIPEESIVTGLI
jgi:glucosylceramidase